MKRANTTDDNSPETRAENNLASFEFGCMAEGEGSGCRLSFKIKWLRHTVASGRYLIFISPDPKASIPCQEIGSHFTQTSSFIYYHSGKCRIFQRLRCFRLRLFRCLERVFVQLSCEVSGHDGCRVMLAMPSSKPSCSGALNYDREAVSI